MHEAGEIAPGDQVCLEGTEDWMEAADAMQWIGVPIQQPNPSAAEAPEPVAKRVERPRFWLCICLINVGLVLCLWNVLLGGFVLVVAVAVEKKVWHCPVCSAKIEKWSKLCPACRTALK